MFCHVPGFCLLSIGGFNLDYKCKNLISVYQTFKNLLQNYLTEFSDIAHKYSLGMCSCY